MYCYSARCSSLFAVNGNTSMQYGLQSGLSDNVVLRDSLWAVRCVVGWGTTNRFLVGTGLTLDARRWTLERGILVAKYDGNLDYYCARSVALDEGEDRDEDALSRFTSSSAETNGRTGAGEKEERGLDARHWRNREEAATWRSSSVIRSDPASGGDALWWSCTRF